MDIIKTKSFTLRVHPAGALLLLFAALTGHVQAALLALLALLLHEGFHAIAILLLGQRLARIELTPFGGVADVDSFQSLPTASQVLIALSGAVGSLFCWAVLRFLPLADPRLDQFAQLNLMLGLFNLLPMLPLDGARALGALGDRTFLGPYLRKAMMGLAFLLSFLLLLAAVYGAWYGHINLTLLFVAPYLCYAARQDYVSQRVKLVEQSLRMEQKLRHGAALRVDGTACHDGVSREQLLRMLLSLPTGRLHYFFFLDPETGRVKRVVEECDLIEEIMGEDH